MSQLVLIAGGSRGMGAATAVLAADARLGAPGQYVDYAAAKGAMDMFTVGQAKEVAESIVWLPGDGASYTTGALLDVAGGR